LGVPLRRTPLPKWVIAQRRDLGNRLVSTRRAAGLSQDQLADRVGVERRTIQRYKSGERDPRYTDLLLIADALGAPLLELAQK
jgi:transcriptional regulator with XRE-family HTH domain